MLEHMFKRGIFEEKNLGVIRKRDYKVNRNIFAYSTIALKAKKFVSSNRKRKIVWNYTPNDELFVEAIWNFSKILLQSHVNDVYTAFILSWGLSIIFPDQLNSLEDINI